MSIDMVVGGQFGGEGKGLISAALCYLDQPGMLVKTGGPNCSHSYGFQGRKFRLRMLPAGASIHQTPVLYPPGALIHVDTLFSEIEEAGFQGKTYIDPKAGLVEVAHVNRQAEDPFYTFAGSTLTGTGAASADRALRRLRLARDEPRLSSLLRDTMDLMVSSLALGGKILVEGSQAYGLSNYHGDYPFTTSRDATTGAFLSQIGLGPRFLGDIVLVLKTFPTRNRHGQGTLTNEVSADLLQRLGPTFWEYGGGSYQQIGEKRRVGLFDFGMAKRAVDANSPTFLAITGFDKLETALTQPEIRQHYGGIDEFRERLRSELGVGVALESWGEEIEKVRDLRAVT